MGKQKEVFDVHENLIRASSPFFDKAMSDSWQKSTQEHIELPDDDPEIFGIYVHWLYRGTLPVYTKAKDKVEWLNILKSHTFGDKVLDNSFQNTAIYALIEKCTTLGEGKTGCPNIDAIQHVYGNTSGSSPIRKLFLDMYVYAANKTSVQKWQEEDIPKAFLFDLASKLLSQQGRPRPGLKASDYYIHEIKEVKSKTT